MTESRARPLSRDHLSGSSLTARLHARPLLATAVVALLGIGSVFSVVGLQPLAAVLVVATSVALIRGAIAVGADPDIRPSLPLLATGPMYAVSWSGTWGWGPLPYFALLIGLTFWAVLIWGILQYPNGAVADSVERVFVVAAFLWFLPAEIVTASLAEPEYYNISPQVWWPTVRLDRELWEAFRTTTELGHAGIGLIFCGLMARRVVRARGPERRVLAPVFLGIGLLAITAGWVSQFAGYTAEPVINPSQQILSGILLAMVATLLLATIQKRLNSAAVADLLLEVGSRPTVSRVEAAFGRLLGDSGSRIHYWDREREAYCDARGDESNPVADPRTLVVPVQSSGGEHLGVLVVDHSLERHRFLLDAARTAVTLSLENIHLENELRAQIAELGESRRRLVTAAVAERQRLERNLHDGFQQHLFAVGTCLGRLHATAPDAESRGLAADARTLLRAAQAGFRRVIRGIYPASLVQGGLDAAVEEVAGLLELDVDIDVPDRRLGAPVEATVYFVISECLTNVERHSGTRKAEVEVTSERDQLRVRVVDRGCGGADPNGHGLRGLRDRTRALGGALAVTSVPGVGTMVEAQIPCE